MAVAFLETGKRYSNPAKRSSPPVRWFSFTVNLQIRRSTAARVLGRLRRIGSNWPGGNVDCTVEEKLHAALAAMEDLKRALVAVRERHS